MSAPAEEPARASNVHVIAHALLPSRRPSRKRKRRREQHLPRPSPNTRRPNGPGAATRPLGPAPGAEAAAFPGTSNREKPTEASRIKSDEAGGRYPNSPSLAHEAFAKTVKPLPAGFLNWACHLFPWAPRRPRPCWAQPHPRGIPQPARLHWPVKWIHDLPPQCAVGLESARTSGNLEEKSLRDGWWSLQHPEPKNTSKVGRSPKASMPSGKGRRVATSLPDTKMKAVLIKQ